MHVLLSEICRGEVLQCNEQERGRRGGGLGLGVELFLTNLGKERTTLRSPLGSSPGNSMPTMRRHTYPSVSIFTEKPKIATYATAVRTTLHGNGFDKSTSGGARPHVISDGFREGGENPRSMG
jgi:hypothetical protein